MTISFFSLEFFKPRFFSVILVSTAILMIAFTGKKSVPTSPPFLGNVDKIVEEEMVKQQISGCAVGVVQNGKIVHVKGYGHHDRLRTKPVTANTVFRWASISKPLTSVAAFKAIETNKLALTDKVTKYMSYWPTDGNKDDILVAHLLNNRSGVNQYTNIKESNYKSKNNFNAKECVEVFSYAPLDFSPGSQYNYTTFGFNLLGSTIEEATNIPYEKYVKDNIADKAGMTSLTAYSSDPGGFNKDCNGFLKNQSEGEVEWKLPGGGWASNIEDLAKFMQGLMNGTFLNNTPAMWQAVPKNSGSNYAYGILRSSLNSELYVWHNGAHNDVRTYMGFFPSSKSGVVVMINGDDYVSEGKLAKKVQAVFGKDWKMDDLPINYCGTNLKCGDNTIGIWRKTGNAQNAVIRRGYSQDEFHAEWEWLLDKGYYCADVETYLDGNTRKWDGIFKKTNKKSAMFRNWDSDGFHDKWEEMNKQGKRLIDIETYMDDGKRKWAGLFLEMDGGYALHRGLNHDQMHDKWVEYGKKGLKLIDIEKYGDEWAAVWVAGPDVAMYRNYDTEDFKQLRRDNNEKGWKLIDVDTYMSGNSRKWCGLWEKTSTPEYYLYGYNFCDWLSTYHNKYITEGYELIDLETY